MVSIVGGPFGLQSQSVVRWSGGQVVRWSVVSGQWSVVSGQPVSQSAKFSVGPAELRTG